MLICAPAHFTKLRNLRCIWMHSKYCHTYVNQHDYENDRTELLLVTANKQRRQQIYSEPESEFRKQT